MTRTLPLITLFMLATTASWSQQQVVESRVYNWSDLEPVKDESRIRRQVLRGTTGTLASLEVHASTLEPALMPHAPHTHADEEELIIIREGNLKVTIKDKSKILGPGSVAFAIPGEEHGFWNAGDTPVTYYILKFKSNTAMDIDRGVKAGGSFMLDWNDIKANTTEKGARRNLFDQPTSMFKRFEMHVTTLNEGLASHDPHSHPAEEMILIRFGETSMQIGEQHQAASPGGVVFLSSRILHNLTNAGKGQCEYYAFQWE